MMTNAQRVRPAGQVPGPASLPVDNQTNLYPQGAAVAARTLLMTDYTPARLNQLLALIPQYQAVGAGNLVRRGFSSCDQWRAIPTRLQKIQAVLVGGQRQFILDLYGRVVVMPVQFMVGMSVQQQQAYMNHIATSIVNILDAWCARQMFDAMRAPHVGLSVVQPPRPAGRAISPAGQAASPGVTVNVPMSPLYAGFLGAVGGGILGYYVGKGASPAHAATAPAAYRPRYT